MNNTFQIPSQNEGREGLLVFFVRDLAWVKLIQSLPKDLGEFWVEIRRRLFIKVWWIFRGRTSNLFKYSAPFLELLCALLPQLLRETLIYVTVVRLQFVISPSHNFKYDGGLLNHYTTKADQNLFFFFDSSFSSSYVPGQAPDIQGWNFWKILWKFNPLLVTPPYWLVEVHVHRLAGEVNFNNHLQKSPNPRWVLLFVRSTPGVEPRGWKDFIPSKPGWYRWTIQCVTSPTSLYAYLIPTSIALSQIGLILTWSVSPVVIIM